MSEFPDASGATRVLTSIVGGHSASGLAVRRRIRGTIHLGVTLMLLGCVQYKAIAPPGADAPSEKTLPSIVTVTTRDSVRSRLKDAAFRHDTLVGRSALCDCSGFVRIPTSDIAHIEGRVSTIESNVAGGLMVLSVATVLLGVMLIVLYTPST